MTSSAEKTRAERQKKTGEKKAGGLATQPRTLTRTFQVRLHEAGSPAAVRRQAKVRSNAGSNTGSNTEAPAETRNNICILSPDEAAVLAANAALFCAMERQMLAARRRGTPLKKDVACRTFGVPGRVFNSARIALDGVLTGIRNKAAADIEEVTAQIAAVESRRKKAGNRITQRQQALVGLRDSNKQALTDPDRRRLLLAKIAEDRRAIVQYGLKLARLKDRLVRLEKTAAAELPSVCFGGRRLFWAQNHLAANGYRDHAEWLAAWRQARDSQFQIVGSADEARGNSTVGLTWTDDGAAILTIPVFGPEPKAPGAGEDHASGTGEDHASGVWDNVPRNKITLGPVRLPHGHDVWRKAVAAAGDQAAVLKRHQTETAQIKALFKSRLEARGRSPEFITACLERLRKIRYKAARRLPKCGHAISYRFLRDDFGWRLFVTVTEDVVIDRRILVSAGDRDIARGVVVSDHTKGIMVSDHASGVVALDFNADHIAAAELAGDGTVLAVRRFPTVVRGLGSGQRRALYRQTAAKIAAWAGSLRKPLAAEGLDFTHKRRDVAASGRKNEARMVSSLAFRQFRDVIVSAACRAGVPVRFVNPAWTSVQGQVLFSKALGLSIHHAAAVAIGRRALGFREEIPEALSYRLFDGTVACQSAAQQSKRADAVDDGARSFGSWREVATVVTAARKGRYPQVYVKGTERRRRARDAREVEADCIPY